MLQSPTCFAGAPFAQGGLFCHALTWDAPVVRETNHRTGGPFVVVCLRGMPLGSWSEPPHKGSLSNLKFITSLYEATQWILTRDPNQLKPPLCKGRWRGVSRVGGIVSLYCWFIVPAKWQYYNPPVSTAWSQPPLHKGAFIVMCLCRMPLHKGVLIVMCLRGMPLHKRGENLLHHLLRN